MTMEGGTTVVAICQSGGEFVTKEDGSMSYIGGEAHALTINRDMPFNDLKSELSSMFNIDTSNMSLKYFLPINKRTLITISSEKDFERMIDFHYNSLTIDIYVSNKIDTRTPRNVAADSGTSIVDTAIADHLKSKRSAAANSKRVTRGNAIADSSLPNIATGETADNNKKRKRKANERITIRIVADDSDTVVPAAPTIDINRQEMLEPDTLDRIDPNSDIMNIIDDTNPHMGISMDAIDYLGSQDSTASWANIITDVGQEFENVRAFRDDLCKYAFAKGFKYRFVKNEHARVTAKCTSENCPWRIHASRSARKKKFVLKRFNNVHTCGVKAGENVQPRAKKQWLSNIIRRKVLDNPESRPRDIARDLYQEYGIHLSYCQAWHAKEAAQKEIHMLQEETYNQLPWLCEQIMRTNPGSVTMITTSVDAKIRRFFVSYYASLHGFEQGCRPLIFLDRICLNLNNDWKVLVAASVDGNDEIFPIAFATVEDETPDSWHWFLVQLKYAITAYHKFTIVSTRRKGLDELVLRIFEDCYHSYSLSHLIEDFKAELKKGPWSNQVKEAMVDGLIGAAQSYLVEDFNAFIDRINSISKDVSRWVMSTKPEHWSNALFMGARYGHLSSDIVDSLTKWIPMKDETSAVQLMHTLLTKTMDTAYSRQQASSTWEGTLTPGLEKKLQKEVVRSRTLNVICSTETMFEVRSTTVNVVNIGSWECTCRRWQITGLPCMHAIAVFDRVDKSVYDYCSRYFRRESYLLTYLEPIQRIPDISEMKFFVPPSSYPPPTNRPPGRPKRKRINPHKTSIRPLRCSRCKVVGHNKATCDSQL